MRIVMLDISEKSFISIGSKGPAKGPYTPSRVFSPCGHPVLERGLRGLPATRRFEFPPIPPMPLRYLRSTTSRALSPPGCKRASEGRESKYEPRGDTRRLNRPMRVHWFHGRVQARRVGGLGHGYRVSCRRTGVPSAPFCFI